jgi:hypothetical protein
MCCMYSVGILYSVLKTAFSLANGASPDRRYHPGIYLFPHRILNLNSNSYAWRAHVAQPFFFFFFPFLFFFLPFYEAYKTESISASRPSRGGDEHCNALKVGGRRLVLLARAL